MEIVCTTLDFFIYDIKSLKWLVMDASNILDN